MVPVLVTPPTTLELKTPMPLPDGAVMLPWLTIEPPIVLFVPTLMPVFVTGPAPALNVPLDVLVTLPVIVALLTAIQLVAPLLLRDAADAPVSETPQTAKAKAGTVP
jgi:hypothetical protein